MKILDFIWKAENPKSYSDLYMRSLIAERKNCQSRMMSLFMLMQPDHEDMYQDEILEMEARLELLDTYIRLYGKNK